MALTQEQQVIFDAVIASLRTNSKTIEQLTPQTSLGSDDWFELNGGRKVSYTVLKDLVTKMFTIEHDSLRTLIGKNVLKSVSFDVGESSAALTIVSAGTTISCNVPVATSAKAGIISSVDKSKIQTAYDNGQTAIANAAAALSKASEALNAVNKLTPIRVESEEALEAMRTLGLLKDGQMYYIPEED